MVKARRLLCSLHPVLPSGRPGLAAPRDCAVDRTAGMTPSACAHGVNSPRRRSFDACTPPDSKNVSNQKLPPPFRLVIWYTLLPMVERDHYDLARIAAETMYNLLELQWQMGELDLDASMMRLKDLSAYSLSNADIQERRQGVELLALGMLFGMSSDPHYQGNQTRLHSLAEETIQYAGQAERIVDEIKQQSAPRRSADIRSHTDAQDRLL